MSSHTAARLRAIPSLTGTAPAWDPESLPADPVTLFYAWLTIAIESRLPEPLAMTLSTVDADGTPDARTVILKDVDERGWAFAGPTSGTTASQLRATPIAALNFWWQPLVRAIRVRGSVVQADPEDVEADLAARSPEARADVAPDGWMLWRLQAVSVEFWQGSPDRRHTRVRYRFIDGAWSDNRSEVPSMK